MSLVSSSEFRVLSMGRLRVRRSGFALFDVMVGGLVMAIALTAIFGLTSRALSAQMRGEKRQQAAMLADIVLNPVLALVLEKGITYPSFVLHHNTLEEH